MTSSQHHKQNIDPNVAYHIEWQFRSEAFIRLGNQPQPLKVNINPIATELRNWLLRKGQVSLLVDKDKDELLSFENPYTYNASTIAGIFTHVMSSSHAFATSNEPISDIEAEIERIRLYNEQVLYTARFCEASIKQLLYCTQISRKLYKDASIGSLLSTKCRSCKGEKEHKISLLESLAHRYGICREFEQCLSIHLKIANKCRNLTAAHSGIQDLRVITASDSKSQLLKDSTEAGKEFVHMLKHISDLETLMISELRKIVNRGFASDLERIFSGLIQNEIGVKDKEIRINIVDT